MLIGFGLQGGNISLPSLSQAQPNQPNIFQSQPANQAMITGLNQFQPGQTNQPKPGPSLLVKQSPPIMTSASHSRPIILKSQPVRTNPNPIIVTQTRPINATGTIIIKTNPKMVTTASSQTQENIISNKSVKLYMC